ncbi:TetR/AcrR family transcriptional regulator [Nocardia spumae]|uniref:TetR/AcrR family transcriptional regulator n=1 Tax=Nocardia spumae TaxID=2887190 RepID=UPI001D156133|nr:TetR/AcrR family transcriptional regulator [Nocardia spumae]
MVTAAEQGRDTRDRLMDAAVALIDERGWGAVTTRLVADRAGVRAGLVHYHFRSVDDLLIDAALRTVRRLVDGVAATAVDDSGSGIAALLARIAEFDDAAAGTRIFSETLLAATRRDRLRAGLAGVLAEFRATLSARLETTVADPEATAAVLVAALDGLVLHRLIDPRVRALDAGAALGRLAGIEPPSKE